MLVLGDAHAADEDNREALFAAYDAADPDVALQAGDLEHYELPVETWFIGGNNEDFDVIDALRAGEERDDVTNAHLIASTVVELEGVRIAGLTGNHAPTRYDKSRSELQGHRRRHFTHEDVEQLAAVDDVDVLLTHEAPTGLLYYGYEPGCTHVDDLLDALEPELCIVGHHHQHEAATLRGHRIESLAPAWERYYELDPDELRLESFETPV